MTSSTTSLKKSKISIETIAVTGLFTALTAILSALPIGINLFGVPATLQTFAMSFIGFLLGYRLGTGVVGVYILLGLIGIPVFNGFHAGPSVLFGPTGGFIFGFLFLSSLSGLGRKLSGRCKNSIIQTITALACSFLGLFICHLTGILQFSIVNGVSVQQSFFMVSLPYLLKDGVFVCLAWFISNPVRTTLVRANLPPEKTRI